MKRMKTALGLAVALTVAVLVAGYWPGPGRQLPESAAQGDKTYAPVSGRRQDPAAQSVATGSAAVEPAPLPSHENTAVDGGIVLDANGNVVPERGLRRLFDYFLTGIGRDDVQGLRRRLAAFLKQHNLPAKVQQQTLDRFDLYVDYQHQLGAIRAPSDDPADLQRAYGERRDLRVEVLGREMANGFFAREEAEDRYVLGMKALQEAKGLSADERRARQDILEQRLPEDIRKAREKTAVALTLQERTSQLRSSGAGEAEIWSMREKIVGHAAAGRLASLDQSRAVWEQRVEMYRQERDQVLAADGLAPEDRQAALERLLQQRFAEHEVRRVRALDRINGAADPKP